MTIEDEIRKAMMDSAQRDLEKAMFSVGAACKTAALTIDDINKSIALLKAPLENATAPATPPWAAMFSGGMNTLAGMRITTSPHLVTTKFRVRGIPAGHKPNRNRPYFRRVTVNIPRAYIVGKREIICHPSIERKLRQEYGITLPD